MPNELKPCPFCGGKVEIVEIKSCDMPGSPVEDFYAKIKCHCGLIFEKDWAIHKALDGYIKLSPDIVTAWNRRVGND